MKDRKLAVRYARALLAALPDASSRDAADAFLAWLADAMEASAELRDVLLNPSVGLDTKKKVLADLAASQGASRMTANFLSVVAEGGRLAALPSIAQVFHEESEAAQGIVSARMTVAKTVPDDQSRRIASALERLSGRRVRLSIQVDPSLVGGAVTQIGSMVFDGSLKTQLNRLHRRMAEE